MRRLLALAAFLLIGSLVPVSAQRGGMRSSGGGRGGFGGHGVAAGHLSGGHSFGGVHSGFGGGRLGGGGLRGGFRDGHFHGRGFHHHCFGFRCGLGLGFGLPGWGNWGWGYYDPFLWDSASSYNYDEEHDQQIASQMNALSIQEQNLREREDWLREREEQDASARRQPVREEEHSAPSPATVLVFRDQHRQEITNYAISGGTLWILSDHIAAKKIPINELDLAATTKVNDERGVEFQVPK